jgi:hypothetical protein
LCCDTLHIVEISWIQVLFLIAWGIYELLQHILSSVFEPHSSSFSFVGFQPENGSWIYLSLLAMGSVVVWLLQVGVVSVIQVRLHLILGVY